MNRWRWDRSSHQMARRTKRVLDPVLLKTLSVPAPDDGSTLSVWANEKHVTIWVSYASRDWWLHSMLAYTLWHTGMRITIQPCYYNTYLISLRRTVKQEQNRGQGMCRFAVSPNKCKRGVSSQCLASLGGDGAMHKLLGTISAYPPLRMVHETR
jgi:hypothetical protein